MKTILIALAVASASMTAFAGHDYDAGQNVLVPSTQKTRAEVQTELRMATALGQLQFGETTYVGVLKPTLGKTRAQVVAETIDALQMGQLRYVDPSFERAL